jgi:hypothetical protein
LTSKAAVVASDVVCAGAVDVDVGFEMEGDGDEAEPGLVVE